ncbi:DNA-3-methyladenine glycosylase-like [Gigantopelta aegis]|uniref:DNA-3-methyladenine glycosylase-like n=1 Tax=Gigantopelta aegis TaxID=1735272 RepID=UPI001B887D3C|nr:DNA-3-methyladenine glycosylase-like [Gigantopelta aegis]XP_041363452.1 DNA-3-methyladenine glycosylase-like [Gigantopelta aegis]
MDDTHSRLGREFFEKSGEKLSRALIGQILVRLSDGKRLAGRIVETEAYLGLVDKAAHSFKGKTARCAAMFKEPGTAYVYNIYGIYCCMNISSQGDGCAVLLRALEPVEGINEMAMFRWPKPKPRFKVKDLCNGPSKLCQSLSLSKVNFDQHDLVSDENLWLEKGGVVPDSMVVQTKRVNIDKAEEWSSKPLRFYVLHNEFVSVRDKEAERQMEGAGM